MFEKNNDEFWMRGVKIDSPVPGCIVARLDKGWMMYTLYRYVGDVSPMVMLAEYLTRAIAYKHAHEWSHREPLVYENLDGVSVTLDGYDLNTWRDIYASGFMRLETLRGTVGMSELGMYARTADKTGIIAMINESGRYAHVLLADGSWVHGVFTRFHDGSFSLA